MIRYLALFLLCSSAHAGEYWYKTAEPAAVVTETYVDKVNCGDDLDALGCFILIGNVGIILIRKGMPEYLRRCTLAHERKHARGWRHLKGWMGFVDCGNGDWISGAALRNMGE